MSSSESNDQQVNLNCGQFRMIKFKKNQNQYIIKYQLKDKIGQGTFANIYKAQRNLINLASKQINSIQHQIKSSIESSQELQKHQYSIKNSQQKQKSLTNQFPQQQKYQSKKQNNSKIQKNQSNFDLQKQQQQQNDGSNIQNLKIAVKVVNLQRVKLQRQDNQIKIMNLLNHKNCLKLFGHIIQKKEKQLIILMPLCQESLFDMLYRLNKNKQQLKQDVIWNLLYQICKGLKHMHQMNVCHRDIKPQNILFKNNVPKIADFGVAKHIDNKKYRYFKTRVGTKRFMAPQVLSSLNKWQDDQKYKQSQFCYTTTCDIWSLAALALDCFGIVKFHSSLSQQALKHQQLKICNNIDKQIIKSLLKNNLIKQQRAFLWAWFFKAAFVFEGQKRINSTQMVKLLQKKENYDPPQNLFYQPISLKFQIQQNQKHQLQKQQILRKIYDKKNQVLYYIKKQISPSINEKYVKVYLGQYVRLNVKKYISQKIRCKIYQNNYQQRDQVTDQFQWRQKNIYQYLQKLNLKKRLFPQILYKPQNQQGNRQQIIIQKIYQNNFTQIIKKSKIQTFSIIKILDIMKQLLEIVQNLNQKNVVHANLIPQNIIVIQKQNSAKQEKFVFLLDNFQNAILLEKQIFPHNIKTTNFLYPQFFQFKNKQSNSFFDKSFNKRKNLINQYFKNSDVWSLAIIISLLFNIPLVFNFQHLSEDQVQKQLGNIQQKVQKLLCNIQTYFLIKRYNYTEEIKKFWHYYFTESLTFKQKRSSISQICQKFNIFYEKYYQKFLKQQKSLQQNQFSLYKKIDITQVISFQIFIFSSIIELKVNMQLNLKQIKNYTFLWKLIYLTCLQFNYSIQKHKKIYRKSPNFDRIQEKNISKKIQEVLYYQGKNQVTTCVQYVPKQQRIQIQQMNKKFMENLNKDQYLVDIRNKIIELTIKYLKNENQQKQQQCVILERLDKITKKQNTSQKSQLNQNKKQKFRSLPKYIEVAKLYTILFIITGQKDKIILNKSQYETLFYSKIYSKYKKIGNTIRQLDKAYNDYQKYNQQFQKIQKIKQKLINLQNSYLQL